MSEERVYSEDEIKNYLSKNYHTGFMRMGG